MARLRTAIATLILSGCGLQGGAGWDTEVPAPPEPPVVSLVLLGDAGVPGRHASTVAGELNRVLEEEQAGGRHPIVLWLGNNVYPRGLSPGAEGHDCTNPYQAWKRRGVAALERAVRKHIERDGESYAVLGGVDWACDNPQLEIQHDYADAHPWIMPAFHYVVRVKPGGSTSVVSACMPDGACTIEPHDPAHPPIVDLVLVDVSPWTAPPAGWTPEHELAGTSLRQLQALMAALAVDDPEAPAPPPRILVSSVPVESAGFHGLGGGDPDATYRALPPSVQEALRQGLFVGVLSGHDHSQQVESDITNSIKRSAKVWIAAPTFQVVSGTASDPDRQSSSTLGFWQGISSDPELYSTHAGFAVLRISPARVDVILHRKGAGWRRGVVSFPLQRAAHPTESPSPSMQPCEDCDEVPPGETR